MSGSGMLYRVSRPVTGAGFRWRVVEVCVFFFFFISFGDFVGEFGPKRGCSFEGRPILGRPVGETRERVAWREEEDVC